MGTAHQYNFVFGEPRTGRQETFLRHLTILHVMVPNIAQQTEHILLSKPDGSSVVDEEDPEAELAEEHDDVLEVSGDDGVGTPVRPDYQRDLRPGPRSDVVSREDVG